jgi:hypothetical protein
MGLEPATFPFGLLLGAGCVLGVCRGLSQLGQAEVQNLHTPV